MRIDEENFNHAVMCGKLMKIKEEKKLSFYNLELDISVSEPVVRRFLANGNIQEYSRDKIYTFIKNNDVNKITYATVNINELYKLSKKDSEHIDKLENENKVLKEKLKTAQKKLNRIKLICGVYFVNGIKIESEVYNKMMNKVIGIIKGDK